MQESLITIGLPCYNAEKYISKAIVSILNQTYVNWKLIIIDDNSTDRSRELIRPFLEDSRIVFFYDGINRGLPERLNEMISLCDTKYFARMDADDIMHIDRIYSQVNFLESNSNIDVLGSYVYSINGSEKILGIRGGKPPISVHKAMWSCVFIHPTVMGKTSWFKKNRYDPNCVRIEDYELWLRTFSDSTFEVLQRPLLFYRELDLGNKKKYWLSKINSFKIVKNTNEISLFNKIIFVIVEHAKGMIYVLSSFLGLERYLVKNRVKKIDDKDFIIGEKELEKAVNNML